jgi:uncharacterized lipoprotein YmbA
VNSVHRSGALRLMAFVALVLVIPACSSVTAPTRFYTLTPVGGSNPESTTDRKLAIGLDPVVIPGYLDRPQIMTRAAPARFTLGEFDQWAEPFHGMVTRILAEDLYRLTNSNEVTVLPQTHETRLDRLVDVVLLRFDAEAGAVILRADWKVFDRNERALAGGRFETQTPVANIADYEGLVTAMSQSLGRLAEEIAKGMRHNQ